MTKSLVITGVRPIFNIEKPIVVLEVGKHEAIVRNPKQALIDLQNGGRALELNSAEFDRGIENVSPTSRATFVQALLDCVGATVTGEISVTKAGENYTPNENHPMFTDAKHPMYGKVKLGESLVAEKGSVWVEGFLTILLTEQDKMRRDVSKNIANIYAAMLGLGAPTAQPRVQEVFNSEEIGEYVPQDVQQEAFNTKAK